MTTTTAGFTLDTLARKKREKLRRQEKDARLHNRFSALLWLGQGRSPGEVAALLGVCPRTVRNWLQLYQRGGLEALCPLEYKAGQNRLHDPAGLPTTSARHHWTFCPPAQFDPVVLGDATQPTPEVLYFPDWIVPSYPCSGDPWPLTAFVPAARPAASTLPCHWALSFA